MATSWSGISKNSATFYPLIRLGSNTQWKDAVIPWSQMTMSWESLSAVTFSGITKNSTSFSGVSKS